MDPDALICPLQQQYVTSAGQDNAENAHCHVPPDYTDYFRRLRATVVDPLTDDTEECQLYIPYNNTFTADAHNTGGGGVIDAADCATDARLYPGGWTDGTTAVTNFSTDLCDTEGVTGFWMLRADDAVSGQTNLGCIDVDNPHDCCTGSGTGECETANSCTSFTTVDVCVELLRVYTP
jgi:hypothetical protein